MAGYGTDQRLTDWLGSNGFVLPVGAPTPAVIRQRGSVYVDAHAFPGSPTDGLTQERAFPRTGATAYGQAIATDVVPLAIEHAAYAAGWFDVLNPGVLTTRSSADQRLKRQKNRVEGAVEVETEYFDNGSGGAANEAVTIPMVEGLLAPFLTSASAGPAIFIV
ncbi:hypothetical protein J2X45_003934 [Caulobacter sp. BE264]|uniref:DnaT-like ssDNA-binding protein n=1 Tax=Caulobacter sp. BE264 TaxID=2817724 RepID=UPI002854AC5B|nr:DnaT-like ssDNA-binding protein [Caulobacter sp. BE264]MDR7232824.1 hypothetical protein [Caulobacter sp. BE264]